ncbi:MAG: hypothetical protein LBE91_09710 [Tannerella sp.]|nr:hypothetical protein [Tannerella sp.]
MKNEDCFSVHPFIRSPVYPFSRSPPIASLHWGVFTFIYFGDAFAPPNVLKGRILAPPIFNS